MPMSSATFFALRDAGAPLEQAAAYAPQGADERRNGGGWEVHSNGGRTPEEPTRSPGAAGSPRAAPASGAARTR